MVFLVSCPASVSWAEWIWPSPVQHLVLYPTGEDHQLTAEPRRVVYTALIGRYEQLNEQPVALETDIEFICFTDDEQLTSKTWNIRLITPRFPLDTIRSARYLKVRGPEILGDYDETLWIDNSVRLRATPNLLLDEWLRETDLAIPGHSWRTSVIGEFDAVAADGYDDPSRVYEQLIHYSTIVPAVLEEVPYWTALLARRRTSEVDAAMQLWWDHLLRYSRRDQLSVNFALRSSEVAVTRMVLDNSSSLWHEWPIRVDRKWDVTRDRMTSALRIPSAEIGRLENELAAIRADQSNLMAECQVLKEEVLEANELAASFQSSASWKLTAPIRRVLSLFHPR
ncbi:glycosyltransferase domain-containing protein [Lacisediminihabitans changchengi]|uniref:DUF616 domain-containing protein n=1 Tax=Lacisediminihabitans changchengi TaxID=2787634 RepID=A0A934SPL8_9MICO|nr:glycosyltransferase domain-containing protein [Lacisediminihabitans changchengi]MBK4346475.1 DUF616 domain-containing protein [Lacisediminihabitans changchengi]MBK4348897.1 DUF616 domain-containing protein [Lacisediminihabitans changchengi]